MTRWLVGVAALAAGAGVAAAQVAGAPGAGPGANPLAGLAGTYAPNFYNRTQQPLSPYLNLLRGGDPGVNYFYGVRPGLNPAVSGLGAGGAFGFQGATLGPPGTGNRFYLQPPAGLEELPYQPLDAARPLPVIPTAAHPVTFGVGPGLGGGFRAAPRTGFTPPPANPRAAPPRR